jgi:hypothetical protein
MTSVGSRSHRPLATGTEVEVLNRYQGRWAAGFKIETMQDGRYTLRRSSDNTVLPAAFARNQVRPRRPDFTFNGSRGSGGVPPG